MLKNFGKRVISFLVAAVMIISLMPVIPIAVSAATVLLNGEVSVNISGGGTTSGITTTGMTIAAEGGWFGRETLTITIYNETSNTATLSFEYNLSGNYDTFKVASATAETSGKYTGVLSAGGSVVINLKASGSIGAGKATLKLSNFSLVAAATSSNVTFAYDSSLGSITVGGAAMANGGTKENVSLTDGVALVATPVSGARFLGWIDTADNALLSTAASYTLIPTANMTVKAVFVGAGSTPWFMVGGLSTQTFKNGLLNLTSNTYYTVSSGTYLFDDLNTAAAKAASSTTKGVVLMNDGTLSAGTYTIPAGVTLLIPFDSANTLYTTAAQTVGIGKDAAGNEIRNYTTPTAYRTLKLAAGAHLVINGAMSLSAKQALAQGSQTDGGSPSGPVSFVNMAEGSSITVNNGGKLYAYGFITGSGTVTAKNGATVYESFQIMDFRGGTQSTDMQNGVFPLSQYYVQNIEAPLTLEYGATEYSYTSIYMQSTQFGSSVGFIGPSGAMFNLTSGSVTKYYDGKTDRLMVALNGEISVSGISMSVGTSTLDSKKYELPVNSNITMVATSGSKITIGQDIALLPGSQITVHEGATCTVSANVYIYDADQWGTYAGSVNRTFIPVTYAPGRTYNRTDADLVDAAIQIDGTVNGGGSIYTTAGGANVFSTGTGVVTLQPGTQTVTHQLIQGVQYVEIPLTPAKLKNQDGSFLQSGNDSYTYTDGFWRCDANHNWQKVRDITAPTCTVDGQAEFQCSICQQTKVETVAAIGHADSNTDHICDNGCDVYQGEHKDDDFNHTCDYGCSVAIGDHEDENKDHICDYGCKENIGTCEDSDKDHKCDHGCNKTYGEHKDDDFNHTCDYGCSVAIGDHKDENKDHLC
ncbi:MAG: hypothetical protein J6K03_01525, partial [Oscillospiraceae bacterium]|nr:hypothetical protein [Oscillospiraceae bacterium]